MDDEERRLLAEKLDKDLEAYIADKVKESEIEGKNHLPENDKSVDELVEELQQHPAFMTEFDETKPMSAAMEGLQAMKYESDSNEDNALSYKEDGNKNFERKKYHWAIDSYTSGIKCQAKDKQLNAVLYTNRAAANFHLGNYLSSFNDCIVARKFNLNHMKAIIRGVECSLKMTKYETAIHWSDEGLAISSKETKLLELRLKAEQLLKKLNRDKRKEKAAKKKMSEADKTLIDAISKRGIHFGKPKNSESVDEDSDNTLSLDVLETHHPSGAKVSLDLEGVLHWPVLFLYPEHGETDFIVSFSEHSRFLDHLETMFGETVDPPPSWDTDRKYKPQNIQIYFEERAQYNDQLHKIEKKSTLLSVLQDHRYGKRGYFRIWFITRVHV